MSIKQRSSVRIISGSKRGSNVFFLPAPGLRPTGDRVRETLFAWLQESVVGSRCLDMFAGSGALGFEAASRGAALVVMVESEPAVVAMLQQNAERLKFENTQVVRADATQARSYQHLGGSPVRKDNPEGGHEDCRKYVSSDGYDVVFVDPPFADKAHQAALELLVNEALLNPGAFVYVECDRRAADIVVPAGWELKRDKVAGDVRAQLYRAPFS